MKNDELNSLETLLKQRSVSIPSEDTGEHFLNRLHQKLRQDAMAKSTKDLMIERVIAWRQQLNLWSQVAWVGTACASMLLVASLAYVFTQDSERQQSASSRERASNMQLANVGVLDYSYEIPAFSVRPNEF